MDNDNDFNVDDLLKSVFVPEDNIPQENLNKLFERRIKELKITPTNVLDILKIQYRTLNGILEGTQKTVDFTNFIKIADFLQLSVEQTIILYIKELKNKFPNEEVSSSERVEFIRDNFDLAVLRRAGFINSINDYEEIEKKITSFFGLKSISKYKKPHMDVAFSSGIRKPKNDLSRSFWIQAAIEFFKEINNTNKYDRKALVNYFPQIRWHSTNVELGLINVIRDLYKIGITVAYQSSLPSINLRGATFLVQDKPCILITNLAGFYPTLWFALVHELFHVIFDWQEIKNNKYHLSDDESEQLTVQEKEKEANEFAREYLFSREKTNKIRPHINSPESVREFAEANHVHPSFVYVFNAYDVGKKDRMAWAKAKKYNPPLDNLIKPFENSWKNPRPITEFAKTIKHKLYN